jgi:hypothetical protein
MNVVPDFTIARFRIYFYEKFGLYYYRSQYSAMILSPPPPSEESYTSLNSQSDYISRRKKSKFIFLPTMKSSGMFPYVAATTARKVEHHEASICRALTVQQ